MSIIDESIGQVKTDYILIIAVTDASMIYREGT